MTKTPHTSTRGTTNAMKNSSIPAICCAKKKPGMCCSAILKTGCEDGGIEYFWEDERIYVDLQNYF